MDYCSHEEKNIVGRWKSDQSSLNSEQLEFQITGERNSTFEKEVGQMSRPFRKEHFRAAQHLEISDLGELLVSLQVEIVTEELKTGGPIQFHSCGFTLMQTILHSLSFIHSASKHPVKLSSVPRAILVSGAPAVMMTWYLPHVGFFWGISLRPSCSELSCLLVLPGRVFHPTDDILNFFSPS